MVIVDTNIIIDHLRQQSSQETALMRIAKHVPKSNLAISVVSIQELYEGQSTRDARKEELLLATISPLKIVQYTFETAQYAGELARDLKKPIELADAAIAATAILNDAFLFTFNTKDFINIKALKFWNDKKNNQNLAKKT